MRRACWRNGNRAVCRLPARDMSAAGCSARHPPTRHEARSTRYQSRPTSLPESQLGRALVSASQPGRILVPVRRS